MPEIFSSNPNQPATPIVPQEKSVSVRHSFRSRAVRGMLSAFMVRPQEIHFETQEPQEEIILFMRQHPITNFNWIVVTLVLLLLPVILGPLIMASKLVPQGIPGGYFVVLPLLWYLGVIGYAFTSYLKWYYNVYIVTTRRIVDIDWISLLYKQLSSTHLDKIQDVTFKQGGLLDSFFNFGNVFIQTAGTEENFEFEAVPQPQQIVQEIDQIIEAHAENKVSI